METCKECKAVEIQGKTNHWPHCSEWDGVKGREVKVSSVYFDKYEHINKMAEAGEANAIAMYVIPILQQYEDTMEELWEAATERMGATYTAPTWAIHKIENIQKILRAYVK